MSYRFILLFKEMKEVCLLKCSSICSINQEKESTVENGNETLKTSTVSINSHMCA